MVGNPEDRFSSDAAHFIMIQEHNTLEEGEFNTAMIRTLLCKETLPVVKAECRCRIKQYILLYFACQQ